MRDEGGRGQKIVDENGDAANEPTQGRWLDLRSWVWNLMLRQIIKTKSCLTTWTGFTNEATGRAETMKQGGARIDASL